MGEGWRSYDWKSRRNGAEGAGLIDGYNFHSNIVYLSVHPFNTHEIIIRPTGKCETLCGFGACCDWCLRGSGSVREGDKDRDKQTDKQRRRYSRFYSRLIFSIIGLRPCGAVKETIRPILARIRMAAYMHRLRT